MNEFQLERPFEPAGYQPEAIHALVEGLSNGEAFQTLLGVTGSGKTFTIANVIQQVQRPTIMLAPNGQVTGRITGGTGRYEGLSGEYSLTWQYVVRTEDGTVQGRTVDLKGRVLRRETPP